MHAGSVLILNWFRFITYVGGNGFDLRFMLPAYSVYLKNVYNLNGTFLCRLVSESTGNSIFSFIISLLPFFFLFFPFSFCFPIIT